VTLFAVLLASFASLLYCYTSQTDLMIGTPSQAGRTRPEVASLLGYFLNPVALRINLQDDPSIRELLLQVKNVTAEAMAYDDVPMEVVAKELHLHDTSSRRAIFKVAISIQPQAAEAQGWRVTSMDASSGGAAWDLYLAFINGMDEIAGRAQYNPDVFESRTIRHALQDLQTMIQTMAADPGQRVSSLREYVGLRSERHYNG
jgi:non-ribosomal peptide synthetase component F